MNDFFFLIIEQTLQRRKPKRKCQLYRIGNEHAKMKRTDKMVK